MIGAPSVRSQALFRAARRTGGDVPSAQVRARAQARSFRAALRRRNAVGDALVELRVATTFIPLLCSAGLANGLSWFLDGWAVLAIYHQDSESWSQLLSVWIARDPGGRTALNHFLSEQEVPPAALLS